MSVKFICKQFALTPNCSCDLMFPWQQDFDSLVFRKLFFGKKKNVSQSRLNVLKPILI